MYIHIFIYIYLYICMYVYIYIHKCMYTYIYIYICTYVYIYAYVCMFMCIYIYIYICSYMYTYIGTGELETAMISLRPQHTHTQIYTRTHTHTHTHTQELETAVTAHRRQLENRLPALLTKMNELIKDPMNKLPIEPSTFEPPVLHWLIRDSAP